MCLRRRWRRRCLGVEEEEEKVNEEEEVEVEQEEEVNEEEEVEVEQEEEVEVEQEEEVEMEQEVEVSGCAGLTCVLRPGLAADGTRCPHPDAVPGQHPELVLHPGVELHHRGRQGAAVNHLRD